MVAVDLPPEVETRLDQAVTWAGRSRSELVLEALLAHLDDVRSADLTLADISSGRSPTTPLEEVERQLGLAG